MARTNIWLWLIFSVALAFSVPGQENPVLRKRDDGSQEKIVGNEVVTLRHNSRLLKREMAYRVVYPFSYKNRQEAGRRYPVIYLLHGLTGHFDNWTDKTKLAVYAKNYDYIIVTPEGNDGWYTDSATAANDKYESYVIQELIPEIDSRFRTLADRDHRAVAGLSMGGFGALKFGLKYPEKFVVVGSFSGALGAASWSVKTLGSSWKALTDSIAGVYAEDDSPTRRENDIFKIVREISPEKIKTLPFIYVDCGTEDFLIKENRDFNALLAEKKIPHEFRELPGKHDWVYWDSQVQEFLRVSQKFIK
jgi:putative tributyrin esterase